MRTRQLIASAALAFAVVLGVTQVASAATTETTTKQTEIAKCVQKALNENTDAGECVKAENPIVPDANELFYGGVAFVILLVIMWKFALPGVRKAMTDRTERIRNDLATAERAKTEAERVLATYQRQVAESKTEATRIIEDARATADALKANLQQRAEEEIAEMKQRAQVDVEAAKAQAIADLSADVSRIAIGAAEVVVQRNLDHATQQQLVENYIAEVGTSN